MSTDKALADVQPGGRVRLGDQAERARFEVWCEQHNYSRSPAQNNCGITVSERYGHPKVQLAWEAWQAALSAQPSPGGQDALLGYVRVEAIKALREDDEVTGVMVHVEERTNSLPVYLAARQPVGDVVMYRVRCELHPHWREVDAAQFIEYTSNGWDGQKLYAAPPAQAVDLGQFRKAVEHWRTYHTGLASAPALLGKEACAEHDREAEAADRLLALIDSQAVGK